MQTSEPNIYAVGECAEHNGTVYGLVAPLYEQGKALASHICGVPCEEYQGSAPSAALKIAGIDVWSAGKIQEDEHTTSIKIYDEQAGVYKKALFVDDKLVTALFYSETPVTSSGFSTACLNNETSPLPKSRSSNRRQAVLYLNPCLPVKRFANATQ
nr:hypothetical protein P5668_19590 [Bacillus subtilis]